MPPDVVNAVVKSSNKYFNFLSQQGLGIKGHNATNIHKIEYATLLENELISTYSCNLPANVSIRSDSSATLILDETPGDEIEIRIIDYDRRTGQTKFATKHPIEGNMGKIIIDFRWIIRRCIEWYKSKGNNLPEITDFSGMNTQQDIINDNNLTNEQNEAVRTVLTSGLSYIWGPPGTGKTQRVLTRAVRHCVSLNQKVLVVAVTNIAVDNALRAILDNGIIQYQNVARIGIPSPTFLNDYPECCEERAFQHEIQQINSQINILRENILNLEREKEYKVSLQRYLRDNQNLQEELARIQSNLSAMQDMMSKNKTNKKHIQNSLNDLESLINDKNHQRDSYDYPKLENDISVLESDQITCIKEIQKFQNEKDNIGFFRNIFTKDKHKLESQIKDEKEHLKSIDSTLINKREQQKKIAPIVASLDQEIANLEQRYNSKCKEFDDVSDLIIELEGKINEKQKTIIQIQNNISNLRTQIEKINGELSHIVEHNNIEQSEEQIPQWKNEIQNLQERLAQYKQDLSQKSVLGMTLDCFIGMTLQESPEINHVFVDEAPYAPIAKILPLMNLRCPISMLGDHFQIPPVCECDNDAIIQSYWAKSAIFLEDAFRFGNNFDSLNNKENPQFQIIKRNNLTRSYRFGQSLAAILDEFVYKDIEFTGVGDDTNISCIDCKPLNHDRRRRQHNKPKRLNNAEVESILNYIRSLIEKNISSIAILAPYKEPVYLIRRRLKDRFGDNIFDKVEVLNTHKSQGREWDYVLFSVCDTGNIPGNTPFFTDSNNSDGKKVLNTTISRARQKLILFMDIDYWKNRTPESLLVRCANVYQANE